MKKYKKFGIIALIISCISPAFAQQAVEDEVLDNAFANHVVIGSNPKNTTGSSMTWRMNNDHTGTFNEQTQTNTETFNIKKWTAQNSEICMQYQNDTTQEHCMQIKRYTNGLWIAQWQDNNQKIIGVQLSFYPQP